MKYLILKSKTKINDAQFVGIIEASNRKEADVFAKKFSNEKHHAEPATLTEIEWLKKDIIVRRDGKNTLQNDFNLSSAKRLN